jgi:hypothetical protein
MSEQLLKRYTRASSLPPTLAGLGMPNFGEWFKPLDVDESLSKCQHLIWHEIY